jgi:HSP20 family protein
MERSFGSFTRVLPIPKDVDTEKAEASFKKGVLTITMPKLEKGKQAPKKIQIKRGGLSKPPRFILCPIPAS